MVSGYKSKSFLSKSFINAYISRKYLAAFVFANFNDLEDVKSKITDKTCAILVETVQGEGGIYPADKEFIEGVYALCQEKDILLISDSNHAIIFMLQR